MANIKVSFKILMLPKKIDWPILAQCDLYAVKEHVERGFRIAEELVRPLSKRVFEQRIKDAEDWKETYRVVSESYRNLDPEFVIENDRYGGYRLVYKGTNILPAKQVLRGKPIGFVKPVPDGITEWSVMRSSRTGEQLLLVGPMRFVNSDCNPNCEYDFSSSNGIVQLKVKRQIYPGTEILVKYGDEFFEQNQCRCLTCENILSDSADQFSNLLLDLIEETAREILDVLRVQSNVFFRSPRRRGVRPKQLAQLYNTLTQDPTGDLQIEDARNSIAEHEQAASVELILPHNEIFQPDFVQLFADTEVNPTTDEVYSAEDSSTQEASTTLVPEILMRASSPVVYSVPFHCSVSTVSCDENFILNSPSNSQLEEFLSLYSKSSIGVADATSLIELLSANLHLTDEGTVNLFSTFKTLLPEDNGLPSGQSFIRRMKTNFDLSVRTLKKTDTSSFCVLNFRNQISEIVRRNLDQILNYANFRKQNQGADLSEKNAPIVKIDESGSFILNLLLSTDGVNIKKSTFKKEVWPIWLQIGDLPPKLRMSKSNIVLAALFVGSQTPPWHEIVPYLRAELVSPVDVVISEEVFLTASLKVVLIVADLCAKAHVLNMYQFNGFFGCNYCFAEGLTIGRTHAYYPFDQQADVREPELNDRFVTLAEYGSSFEVRNVAGVKGRSAFSSIVEGLPLAAPIDYMHCVLLGIFPDLLKLILRGLSFSKK